MDIQKNFVWNGIFWRTRTFFLILMEIQKAPKRQ